MAIVHEWNEPAVIRLLGPVCARAWHEPAYFHDTHYRVVLDDAHRASLGLEQFAGILAYSPSVAERYRSLGFEQRERAARGGRRHSLRAPGRAQND